MDYSKRLPIDNQYITVLPQSVGTSEYASGSIISNHLILGRTDETWTHTTTNSGISFTCNGAGTIQISKSGYTTQNINMPITTNSPYHYVILFINDFYNPTSMSVFGIYPNSRVATSSGVQHWHWCGVNGAGAAGKYPTLSEFNAAAPQYGTYIYGVINISTDGKGAVVEWENPRFKNGATYLTAFWDPTRYTNTEISAIYTNMLLQDLENLPTDPYEPGGTSGPGGGDGTFDFTSTPIDFVGAPTIGAYDTGMVNLYVPSAADLRSLSAYLWAGAFDLDNFKKLVADPMDAIIGLSILPLTAAQIGTSASTLAVGNVSTGISMPRATSQYVTIDCGSVQILPKWGAYLDFAPYSKLQLYLPYIGIVDISPDDCMNGTIAVRYTVDILSGTCYAQVKCNDHVLYNFGATCSTTCPVTSGQYQNVAFAALGAIGGIAGAVVSGMAGNVGGVTGGIENAANSVLSSFKPDISRSGGAGGSAGLMGHQIPYLILTVPRMCTPGYQNEFIGYPAYSTQTLGDLSGYTEIDSIHPAGIPCSEDELAEIMELLNGGVFL